MSGLKLNFPPHFPSQVNGGVGIDVAKSNGNWTVSIDYSQLPVISPFTPGPQHYCLVYDSSADEYFLVPASSI